MIMTKWQLIDQLGSERQYHYEHTSQKLDLALSHFSVISVIF